MSGDLGCWACDSGKIPRTTKAKMKIVATERKTVIRRETPFPQLGEQGYPKLLRELKGLDWLCERHVAQRNKPLAHGSWPLALKTKVNPRTGGRTFEPQLVKPQPKPKSQHGD